MVAALTPKQWSGLVRAFELDVQIAELEATVGVRFEDGDTPRFVHRPALFALFEKAASQFDYAEIAQRSEEHTSELQSLMRISYAVFCLKNKKKPKSEAHTTNPQSKGPHLNTVTDWK